MTEGPSNLDVSGVKVTDEDGFFPYGMMFMERIWM